MVLRRLAWVVARMLSTHALCRGRENAFSAEAYYQPSMLEDPWKHLRQQQQQQQPPDVAAQPDSTKHEVEEVDGSRSHGEGAADRPWH